MNIFVFETSLEASQYAYDLVAKALESGASNIWSSYRVDT